MTRDERDDPTIIDGSRRLRIANGSGTQTADVSQLIKQFREMQKLMKRMPGISGTKGVRGRKGKKGRKGGGGRVTPPGGGRTAPDAVPAPAQPFTLPGPQPTRTAHHRRGAHCLSPLAHRSSWFAVPEHEGRHEWPSSSA